MKAQDLFDLPTSLERFSEFFSPEMAPWEWVGNIKEALASVDFSKLESKKDIPAGVQIEGDVYIHPSVSLPPYAHIKGPAWIGAKTEIRIGCFIRGNVIVGEGCVLGNSCEYKNSMLMDKVETPHYNYVGDSILGYRSHMGAGSITSNVKSDKTLVCLKTTCKNIDTNEIETGLKKFGAMIGDLVEIGCNSVLNPGTVIGKNTTVYPLSSVRGVIPSDSIYKSRENIVSKNKRTE
jgi:NDP-sugar pyrophosphorylase family protein